MTDLRRAHNDWLDPDSPRRCRVPVVSDEWLEDRWLDERMEMMAKPKQVMPELTNNTKQLCESVLDLNRQISEHERSIDKLRDLQMLTLMKLTHVCSIFGPEIEKILNGEKKANP